MLAPNRFSAPISGTSSRGVRASRWHSSMIGLTLSSTKARTVSRTSRSSSLRSASSSSRSTPGKRLTRNLLYGSRPFWILAGSARPGRMVGAKEGGWDTPRGLILARAGVRAFGYDPPCRACGLLMPDLDLLLLSLTGLLAFLGAIALDWSMARKGLTPPGFREPWRRWAATLVVALFFWIGITGPLSALGQPAVEPDLSTL